MAGFDERVLNGMSVFAAIVDAGTFAAAGEQLGLSQPGVSRAVARLEARLGVRLFDRTTRAISLTDEGRRFHGQITPLIAGLEEVVADVATGAKAVRGRLRVNIDPYFSRLILAPRLQTFLRDYPDLLLELVTRDRLGDLVADGFDLAVRFGEPRESSLVARKLLETRILTVAAPAYLKKHGRPATPRDLERGHARIEFRDPETGRPFQWEFRRKGKLIELAQQGRLVLNDVGTLHAVCVDGYGIGQVMQLGTEALFAAGRLVELFPDWPDERFPLYALHPSRLRPPAKTRAFLDFVIGLTASLGEAADSRRRVSTKR